jgi:hypothetical protein
MHQFAMFAPIALACPASGSKHETDLLDIFRLSL